MNISIDDFKKVEIKVGEIISAEKVLEADKLVKLSVNFGLKSQGDLSDSKVGDAGLELGEKDIRQIISGISMYFEDPSILIGKKCAFATNLEPRVIKGLTSEGMILAVSGDNFFSLLSVDDSVVPGSSIK